MGLFDRKETVGIGDVVNLLVNSLGYNHPKREQLVSQVFEGWEKELDKGIGEWHLLDVFLTWHSTKASIAKHAADLVELIFGGYSLRAVEIAMTVDPKIGDIQEAYKILEGRFEVYESALHDLWSERSESKSLATNDEIIGAVASVFGGLVRGNVEKRDSKPVEALLVKVKNVADIVEERISKVRVVED